MTKAVRHGDWKLAVPKGGVAKARLYNLAKDPGETTDLAQHKPEKTAEMKALLAEWEKQTRPRGVKNDRKRRAIQR